MDTIFAYNGQRTQQIRLAIIELARLLQLRQGDDRDSQCAQFEQIRLDLTGLLQDEYASLGVEQAIRDLFQDTFLGQRVLRRDVSYENYPPPWGKAGRWQ